MGKADKAQAKRKPLGSKVIEVPVSKLKPATWNPKEEGTEEQRRKLRESIEHDGSAGVFAVREVGGGYEVMDGNHRLEEVQEAGWETMTVENFGRISKAQAIMIADRRNEIWFEVDPIKRAKLMATSVFPHFPIESYAAISPSTPEELEALKKLAEFDWSSVPELASKVAGQIQIYVRGQDEIAEWKAWDAYCIENHGTRTPGEAVMHAVRQARRHEESVKKKGRRRK